MRMGLGMFEMLIIILVAAGIFTFFFRKKAGGSASSGGNLPHPRLSKCPGCGAPITAGLDNCPQCGLRLGL